MAGFVYKWTNKINNRWYIGSHKGTIDDGYICSSQILKLAMKKYGMDSFIREILYEGRKYRETELEFLVSLDAARDPLSYNLKNNAAGGNGGASKGRTQSLEERQKRSQIMKGKLIGEKNPFYGKTHSKTTREYLSKINLGRKWEDYMDLKTANRMRNHNPLKGKTYEEILGPKRAKSRRMFGENNPSVRQEVKDKISKSWRSRPLTKCPHCNIQSKNKAAMMRWHFDNCKGVKLRVS